jgi:hypothetical protein
MLISDLFYFLWDDPLFTNSSSIEEWELKDPEFIELRRQARLLALETLYIRIHTLQRQLAREKEFHQEAEAREVWTINQFLKDVPPEQAQAILIDRKVNDMDPDFSFVKAITS